MIGTFKRWVRDGAEDKDGIFAEFENLRSVKFLLPWVTHVGDDWVFDCRRLENPSFIGLSSLETVGSRWMPLCRRLENPSFIGLSSLLEVGTNWMTECDTLANPSFTGLSSLEKVGSYGHKKVQEYFIEQIRYYNETADRAYYNDAREFFFSTYTYYNETADHTRRYD